MTDATPVMFACYEVEPDSRSSFIQLLNDTEAVYRSHSVITDLPIIRLESMKDPGFIVEIIEWKSQQALASVMENEEIQEKWSEIKAAWKDGDFPLSKIPESSSPWSVMRRIP